MMLLGEGFLTEMDHVDGWLVAGLEAYAWWACRSWDWWGDADVAVLVMIDLPDWRCCCSNIEMRNDHICSRCCTAISLLMTFFICYHLVPSVCPCCCSCSCSSASCSAKSCSNRCNTRCLCWKVFSVDCFVFVIHCLLVYLFLFLFGLHF